MSAERDLSAVHEDGLESVLERSLDALVCRLLLCSCHDELLVEEFEIACEAKITVDSLQEPESVVRPPAGFFSDPVEVVVGEAFLVNVFDPACEHLLYEVLHAHSCEIVHGSVDVLDLTETDLTVALLRPVERSGNEGLVEDLERKVVVYVSLEISILVADLHVFRIFLRKSDDVLEVLREVCGTGDVCAYGFHLGDRGNVGNESFVYRVRRHACKVVGADRAACLDCERCGQCKEAGALS